MSRILLSGASGFIGSSLRLFLQNSGHIVFRLIRSQSDKGDDTVYWDPAHGKFPKEGFEGFDAVIHLAGINIAEKRWTKERKEELFLSRCRDTWLLSQVLCRLYQPPKVVICASAIGFYGDRGDEELTEDSSQGTGFLADLCGKWEMATEAIENRGSRVVHPRFGAVLSSKGGMLRKILPIFKMGLGGKLGSGEQWFSWIVLEDLLGGILHCLRTESLSGPVNFVSPHSVRQKEFAKTLAKRLHRPCFARIPAFVLKIMLGEMAKELLLAGQKVKPVKLLQTRYAFRCPELSCSDFFL